MKALMALSQRLHLHLKPEYYQADIDPSLANGLAILSRKNQAALLLWLRKLALKTLARLQRHRDFRGDTAWQTRFSEARMTLTAASRLFPSQQFMILQEANDLIEPAHQVIATRAAIVQAVSARTLLSTEQEWQYAALRSPYQQHNAQLNVLHQQISAIQFEYNRERYHHHQKPVVFKEIPLALPRSLFDYAVQKESLRVTTAILKGHLRSDQDAPTLYQELTHALIAQLPTVEKTAEDIKAAQAFLTHKTTQLWKRADTLQKTIQQEVKKRIEHRTQLITTHAKTLERLSYQLDQILHQLNTALIRYDRPGRPIQTEIQRSLAPAAALRQTGFFKHLSVKGQALAQMTLQAHQTKAVLGNKKVTPDQITQLQAHIQQLDVHRQAYASAMTSNWSAFFSKKQETQRNQELQLNQTLQSNIAELINPLSNLSDVHRVVPTTEIQQKNAAVQQLETITSTLTKQPEKTDSLTTTFSR